jgi:hypothetical protein
VVIVSLLVLGLTAAQAQQAARSGEELYIDQLGCWNCHGQTGTGGGAGPPILKSRLPLRSFVARVRLPSGTMPRFSSGLASDAELATVYRWLEGADAVESPAPISIGLKGSGGVTADGQKKAETEVELTVRTTEAISESRAVRSFGYRVTLAQANAPVANQTLRCQLAGREDWSTFTTDEHGEAVLGPEQGFVLADAREPERPTARLRAALAPGRYALLVEAIDHKEPAHPVVAGIGTAILNVE